jgi:hypothetical protein
MKKAKIDNAIKTTHGLDFKACRDRRSHMDLMLFRVGTCHGQWRVMADAYEIISVINDAPGNGHFQDVLDWFEFAARRDGKTLRFMAILNDRFAQHLMAKRGFKPLVLEKEFEENVARAAFNLLAGAAAGKG